MTTNEYQSRARDFSTYGGNEMYPLLGLAEEAGEVVGKVAKYIRAHNGICPDECDEYFHEFRNSIKKELGDVCWMVAEICSTYGLLLEDVMESNIAKLEDRRARGVIVGEGDDR